MCSQFEAQNRSLVAQRLGMGSRSKFEAHSSWDDCRDIVSSLGDLRYWVWALGVVLSNLVRGTGLGMGCLVQLYSI